MTKKKIKSKKSIKKNVPKNVVKEVTTIETKSDGYWYKIVTIKYIKKLMCPSFMTNKMIAIFASVPLLLMIGVILWKIFAK